MSSPAPTPRRSLRRRLARHAVRVLAGGALFLLGQAARELGPGHGPDCSCAVAPWLGLRREGTVEVGPPPAPASASLRVVAFNIHSGLGPDLVRSRPREQVEANLRAVARAIAEAAPADAPVDAVALNEVDFEAARSGRVDQAAWLARELERLGGRSWQVVRGVTWTRERPGDEVRFGNALLVRHPIVRAGARSFDEPPAALAALTAVPSPKWVDRLVREVRGVVEVTIATPAGEVDLYATHLDAFSQAEREAQAVHLSRRLVPGRTSVVLGDLNAVPAGLTRSRRPFQDDLTHDLLTSGGLADARVILAARTGRADLAPWATYPSSAPRWPLDGVLATLDLSPLEARTIGGTASDHRGIAVSYGALDGAARSAATAWHAGVRGLQRAHVLRCLGGSSLESAALLRTAGAESRRRRLVAESGYGE